MNYDNAYRTTAHFFGREPEPILREYYPYIYSSRPVLDVGAGQGRNALFLARSGYVIDAIDPSKVAIDTVSATAEREGLSICTYHCGFDAFTPHTDFYAGVLIFGLIQDLTWDSIHLLREKITLWTGEGSIVFVTAFTTEDPSFSRCSNEWKKVGRNSFEGEGGEIRTYLAPGEILGLFNESKTIHHWEGFGAEHRHGENQPHVHFVAKAVFQRK